MSDFDIRHDSSFPVVGSSSGPDRAPGKSTLTGGALPRTTHDLPAADSGAAGPPVVELGDQEISTQTFHETMVWNLETTEANVVARVEGDPSVQLVSAPGRLVPSREPGAMASKFRLVYSPTKRGAVTATLRVLLDWRAGARKPMELTIPIKGAAHAAGTPTLADEAAQEAHRAQQQREAAQRSSDQKRREAREDEGWKTRHVPGDEYSREALEVATEGAKIAITSLFAKRAEGVFTAEEEAKQYHHNPPKQDESLLASLAMAGLEIATAGIAAAIARRLQAPLEKLLTSVTEPHLNLGREAVAGSTDIPSRYVVATLTDAIKQSIRTIGKGLLHPTNTAEEPGRSLSADTLRAFFGGEHDVLIDSRADAEHVSQRTKAELMPRLDLPGDAPRNAVRAMDMIAKEITNQGNEAMALQAQTSAMHWMRYLAQSSLGTTSGPDGTLTDMSTVHSAPGLVDLVFAGSAAHPETPVTLRSVFVQGVSNAIAQRLVRQSLLGVAVRAKGVPSDGDAELPVSVTRDEGGNITYSDHTLPPGVPGASWLARKAGDLHGGASAELRGARKLIEEDLASKPISADMISTDSSDK